MILALENERKLLVTVVQLHGLNPRVAHSTQQPLGQAAQDLKRLYGAMTFEIDIGLTHL